MPLIEIKEDQFNQVDNIFDGLVLIVDTVKLWQRSFSDIL